MYWQENQREEPLVVPRDVVDLCFGIRCRELPVDHAWPLRSAVVKILPWIENEPLAAIHSIHVASSGNGWVRPAEAPGNMMQLSRRTRLILRVPASREDDARQLRGSRLELAGTTMEIGDCRSRMLSAIDTVFARSISVEDVDEEELFTRRIADELVRRDIVPRKMLCGLRHIIHTPDGEIPARSVLLSDLDPMQAIRLQENGIGPGRTLGCGIFLPHKSLAAVGSRQDIS
jgi:CRISPR-associated protein Cas6